MKKRRKTIYAGNLVKVVEYTPPMPRDTPQQRAAKHKATTEAQKRLNYRTAQGKLEVKLAANFTARDYFCTFTYAPGREPRSRKEANQHKAQYVRKVRAQRRKRGQVIKWVFSVENKHGEGRYHLHAVISSADPSLDFDELRSLWPYGHVEIARLFDSEHMFNTWLDVARYMTKERPEDGKDCTPVGAQIYSCSRNFTPPRIETEWIDEGAPLDVPPGAFIIERAEVVNEYSRYRYLKYMTEPLYRKE